MKQTASIDKIISSVDYAFEMYISEFSGMSDFNEEEVEQERKEAIDFIKSQQEKIEQLQQKWIPVSERLPKNYENVIVYQTGNLMCAHVIVGYHYGNDVFESWFTYSGEEISCVTHWMPFPKPPKKGGDGDG